MMVESYLKSCIWMLKLSLKEKYRKNKMNLSSHVVHVNVQNLIFVVSLETHFLSRVMNDTIMMGTIQIP